MSNTFLRSSALAHKKMPPVSLDKGNLHRSVFMILKSGMFPLIKRALSDSRNMKHFLRYEWTIIPTNKTQIRRLSGMSEMSHFPLLKYSEN